MKFNLRDRIKQVLLEYSLPENEYHDLINVSVSFASNPNKKTYYGKNDNISFYLKSTKDYDKVIITYQIKMKKEMVGSLLPEEGAGHQTDNWTVKVPNENGLLEKGKTYKFSLEQDCNELGRYISDYGFVEITPAMGYYKNNPWGQFTVPLTPLKINEFKESTQTMNACKAKYSNFALQSAKNWWRKNLNDSTAKRIADVNRKSVDYIKKNIFPKYLDAINKMKYSFLSTNSTGLNYFYSDSQYAWAWVYGDGEDFNIYINCANYKTEDNPVGTLVHEIQHILYGIYKMTPEKNVTAVVSKAKITDIFGLWNVENWSEILNQMIDNLLVAKTDTHTSTGNKTSQLKIPQKIFGSWLQEAKNNDPKYACSPTEQLSRIKSFQQRFNIPIGGFTVEFFEPYILRKKSDSEMSWFLNCWALNGFKLIELVVRDLNQLIAYETDKTKYQDFA